MNLDNNSSITKYIEFKHQKLNNSETFYLVMNDTKAYNFAVFYVTILWVIQSVLCCVQQTNKRR